MSREDARLRLPSEDGPARSPRFLLFVRLVLIAVFIAVPFLTYRLALVTHSIAVQSQQQPFPATVFAGLSRVIDADTIEVFVRGRRERVQLLGVDGPELFTKERKQDGGRLESEWRPTDDPKAVVARERLAQFLESKSLALEFDPEEDQMDRYGRLLVWVWADESNGARVLVNEWLICEGLAVLRPGRKPLKYDRQLESAASERAEGKP